MMSTRIKKAKHRMQKSDRDLYHIVACDSEGGIGKDGKIPWGISNDMLLFREFTKGNKVIMGRKTFENLDGGLEKRVNIVLTNKDYYNSSRDNLYFVSNIGAALDKARVGNSNDDIYIIGGQKVYGDFFDTNILKGIYMSIIDYGVENGGYDCDKFYPPFSALFEHYKDSIKNNFIVEDIDEPSKDFQFLYFNFD